MLFKILICFGMFALWFCCIMNFYFFKNFYCALCLDSILFLVCFYCVLILCLLFHFYCFVQYWGIVRRSFKFCCQHKKIKNKSRPHSCQLFVVYLISAIQSFGLGLAQRSVSRFSGCWRAVSLWSACMILRAAGLRLRPPRCYVWT